MRISPIAIIAATLMISVLLAAPARAEMDKGPEVMDVDVNKKGKKVPGYKHRKHQELPMIGEACETCHHTAKKGEQPVACGKCHTHPKDKDAKTGAIGFKKAFHDTCRGCHKKQGERPALRKCKTCHPKVKAP